MKKGNQLFRATMSFVFFLIFIFIMVSCTPIAPEITGSVYGIVAEPTMEVRDITGYNPISEATVSITDASGVSRTTATNADGYYFFAEIELLPNTVINIRKKTTTGVKAFKDVVPQAVFPDDSYDAGITDAFSTARALVIESLVSLGMAQSQIDLEEISDTNGFDWLVAEINKNQQDEIDFNNNLQIQIQSNVIANRIISPLTPEPNFSSAKVIIDYQYQSSLNDILDEDISATINNDSHTVTLNVPYDTDRTALVSTFIISEKASAKVGNILQQSAVTANNFTKPVIYTIIAEDGSAQDWVVIVNENLGPLDHFNLSGCSFSTIAGEVFSSEITITAYDGKNRIKTDYTGTVSFISTDIQAVLPEPYIFTAENQGAYTLPGSAISLKTAGMQTISVSDNNISLTSAEITVNPAVKKKLTWVTQPPASVIAGEEWDNFSIEITDAYGNRTNDNDEITVLANYVVSKNGIEKVPANTNLSVQNKTVNAIDGLAIFNDVVATGQGTITLIGSADELEDTSVSNEVNIFADNLHHIVITPESGSIAAGESQSYKVQAFDAYNNSLGYVTDETEFSIDDDTGSTWNGSTYKAEIAGTWTVTGTYNAKSDTAELTVNPGPLNRFNIKRIDNQVAGIPFDITIIAVDEYWNTVSTYNGENTLSNYAGTISPTSTESFNEGLWNGEVTISKAATCVNIITTGSGITSSSNTFDVLTSPLQ